MLLTIALALALIASLVALAWIAVRDAKNRIALGHLGDERDELAAERDQLKQEVAHLQEKDRQLVATEAVLAEKARELERLRSDADAQSEAAKKHEQRLDLMAERLQVVQESVQGAASNSDQARAGAERIEGQLLGFTRRIANPQSRGAFGEDALRNQLDLLGLREGRDFERQVQINGGSRRIDYVVNLHGATVGLDPKFALDPELEGFTEALAGDDQTRLTDYAKRLVARAKELARREYWAHLERSPSFILMYVPVEGAQEAFAALPKFSYEKFAIEHGVYVVTPLQLASMLGVIADVAHLSRREEELDAASHELTELANEMARFCDHYARHGKQIAAVVNSYNDGAAMLSSRGGLGRITRRAMGFARRMFKLPDKPEIAEVRSDCADTAEQYRELSRAESSAEAA